MLRVGRAHYVDKIAPETIFNTSADNQSVGSLFGVLQTVVGPLRSPAVLSINSGSDDDARSLWHPAV